MPSRLLLFLISMAMAALLGVAGCSALPPLLSVNSDGARPTPTSTPVDRWSELLERTPYPYSAPLPPAEATSLDGSYAKVDPGPKPAVHCRRCPDFLPEGGVWKLYLDDGIYRIYYAETGWRSLGSFTVTGDQVMLFNDPNCTDITGLYTWHREPGQLTFSVVDDPCSGRLRAANFIKQPWLSCQPPNAEAGITDHWQKPPGC